LLPKFLIFFELGVNKFILLTAEFLLMLWNCCWTGIVWRCHIRRSLIFENRDFRIKHAPSFNLSLRLRLLTVRCGSHYGRSVLLLRRDVIVRPQDLIFNSLRVRKLWKFYQVWGLMRRGNLVRTIMRLALKQRVVEQVSLMVVHLWNFVCISTELFKFLLHVFLKFLFCFHFYFVHVNQSLSNIFDSTRNFLAPLKALNVEPKVSFMKLLGTNFIKVFIDILPTIIFFFRIYFTTGFKLE